MGSLLLYQSIKPWLEGTPAADTKAFNQVEHGFVHPDSFRDGDTTILSSSPRFFLDDAKYLPVALTSSFGILSETPPVPNLRKTQLSAAPAPHSCTATGLSLSPQLLPWLCQHRLGKDTSSPKKWK